MPLADLLDTLSKGGVLGVAALMIWMLLTEKVVPKARLDAAIKREQELQAQRQEATLYNRTQYAATLKATTESAAKIDLLIEHMDEMTDWLKAVVTRLDRQSRESKPQPPPPPVVKRRNG